MKRIKFTSILIALVFIINGCFYTFAAPANDLSNKTKEKNKIQSDINNTKKKQEATKKEIKDIENRITNVTSQLDEISATLNTLGSKKADVIMELAEAESKEEKQEKLLKRRLRSIYEDGATSYFSILMSSKSIFEFFYNLDLLRDISEHDDKILKDLTDTKKKVAEKKSELEAVIASETAKQNELTAANSSLKNQMEEKEKYQNTLDSNLEQLRREYDKVEKEEAQLRAQVAAQARQQTGSNVPKSYVGGMFTWPSPGYTRITSPFGYRNHPTLKQYKFHAGIDIGVPSGNNIVAAADGVVTVSTYESGYGNYVAINHGGGIVTLYGHNSSLLVRKGESVKKGQTIAISGSTGRSTGPHLHFEVLVNGSAVNPMNYFK